MPTATLSRPKPARRPPLLDGVNDAVITTNADLIITHWNHGAELLYGWSAREAIGRSVRELLCADISDEQFAAHLETLRTTGHYRHEIVHHRRDGHPLLVESNILVLRNAAGAINGYIRVSRDVSRHRNAAVMLERSERRFRALIEHSFDAISLFDAEGIVLYSTPSIKNILGYTAEEFEGMNAFEIAHPDDVGNVRDVQTFVLSHHAQTSAVLLRARHKDGSWRWIEGYATNLLAEPAVGAVVVNYRDVTRRKNAEDALRVSAERLQILLDMDEAILAAQSPEEIANAALSRLLRLTPCRRVAVMLLESKSDQVVSLAVLDTKLGERTALPAGNRLPLACFKAAIEGRLSHGEIHFTLDIASQVDRSPALRALHAEGISDLAAVPIIAGSELIGMLNLGYESGQMPGEEAFEIWREVAGRLSVAISQARLHRQVHEGRQQLQALSRQLIETQEAERRHLARELHDEIGQALTAIKMSLQSGQARSDRVATAEIMEDCIDIVEDALSRVRNLSLDLRPSLLDDLGLVAALRWYVDRQAGRADLQATFTTQGFDDCQNNGANPEVNRARLPAEVETACFRVAQEAITNVLRHAEARRFQVKLRRKSGVFELVVRDDGHGFDVAAARQRAARGGSLGLLGMEERVRLAGGQFTLESSPERGTHVRVRFPLETGPLERRVRRRAARC